MNKKLKVIQLIDSLNPGGAEMMAVNIANGLVEKGVKSYLCATRLEGDLKEKIGDSVGYLFLNKQSALDFKSILKLRRFIKSNQITIIHAHSSSYFTAVLIKFVSPKIKIVWQDHYGNSENLKDRNAFLIKVMSIFFDSVISVNSKLKSWARENLSSKKIYFIPNFASFPSNYKRITFLKGIENKRIICLANLREQKDHINLLKAFFKVHKKKKDWTLHLVGVDLKDNYSDRIKTFIVKNKLSDSVFLYGACQDVEYVLSQASIGVLSSKSEGLPIALLEYGLAKLPVVVTNVGDCGAVVVNDKNGLLVASKDSEALEVAILKLIMHKDLSKIMGIKLYETVILNFSKEKYIEKLISIYN